MSDKHFLFNLRKECSYVLGPFEAKDRKPVYEAMMSIINKVEHHLSTTEEISLIDYSESFADVERYMDIWDWLVAGGYVKVKEHGDA